MTEDGDGAWLLFKHAHGDDRSERSIEVRASITPAGYGEAQLTGEYIGCKPNSCRPIASVVAGTLYLQKEAPTPTGVVLGARGGVRRGRPEVRLSRRATPHGIMRAATPLSARVAFRGALVRGMRRLG